VGARRDKGTRQVDFATAKTGSSQESGRQQGRWLEEGDHQCGPGQEVARVVGGVGEPHGDEVNLLAMTVGSGSCRRRESMVRSSHGRGGRWRGLKKTPWPSIRGSKAAHLRGNDDT
jgi:hypothetical protein